MRIVTYQLHMILQRELMILHSQDLLTHPLMDLEDHLQNLETLFLAPLNYQFMAALMLARALVEKALAKDLPMAKVRNLAKMDADHLMVMQVRRMLRDATRC